MTGLKFTQSLSFRLSLFVAAVVLVGVSTVATLFIFQDFRKTIQAEQGMLENTSYAFAAASSMPLAANDTSAVYQVLRGISDVGNTIFINVKDKTGRTVAEIGGSVSLDGRDGDIDAHSIWSLMSAVTLSATAPVWSSGEQIGELSIHSDISWLREQYKINLMIMIAVALICAALIAAASNLVIARALGPLRAISGELMSMRESTELSARFKVGKNDEVGVLASAFNDAFETIQKRDKAIRHHRDTLEITVEERTSELKIAADEARQANAAKSDFLATMSHEIRTPMNGMLVMAELLSASDLSSRQQRFAEVIARSGNSLLHIINDILDMSKIEAGKLELEEIPFSLSTLVEDTVSLFAARANEKALKVGVVIAPDIADQLIGDPTRLGQVLSNLTNNALKFTETGGVTIRVLTVDTSDNSQRISISVTDTGIGIAPDKLEAIFEAFSQADQTTTRNYGGTGLGLSISKRLTEAMNGRIFATSIEGEGTTFHLEVEFPIHAATKKHATPKHAFKVAVVDRSPVLSAAAVDAFNLFGLNASSTPHGQLPKDGDLVLLGMGENASMDGIAADVPIILMTEYGEPGNWNTTDANVVGHVASPLVSADIERIIVGLNSGDWGALVEDQAERKNFETHDQFAGLRVLAVDDNAINREVLNEALSALKVKAVFASSGRDAVDLATNEKFDFVFMDCSMPGMDGYQATAAIREDTLSKEAYIVALTAHVTGPSAEKWRSAGMDNYVAKPFTVSQLSQVLSQARAQVTSDVQEETNFTEYDFLSVDVIAMFDMVSKTTGDDMKSKIFTMFCDDVDQALLMLIECCQSADDLSATKELAHSLKSMCSSAGALKAQLICDAIEVGAEQQTLPTTGMLEQLRETICTTKALMQQEIVADENRHYHSSCV